MKITFDFYLISPDTETCQKKTMLSKPFRKKPVFFLKILNTLGIVQKLNVDKKFTTLFCLQFQQTFIIAHNLSNFLWAS